MSNELSEKTNTEVYALARFVRMSPTKLRRVANLIRKKPYLEAKAVLKLLPHKGAGIIYKVLHSAISNAINNNKMDESALYIKTIMVDEGFQIKRSQPKARGRMFRILKRTSHVKVVVAEKFGRS
ncbi:MAG: 50S ribosomal protein L22 [Candidatus Margulisiibacteriota bacterium]